MKVAFPSDGIKNDTSERNIVVPLTNETRVFVGCPRKWYFKTGKERYSAEGLRTLSEAMKGNKRAVNHRGGWKHTPESLKKMSEAQKRRDPSTFHGPKGRTAWNKGMKMSEDFCRKVSEGHKGQPCWRKGKIFNPEYPEGKKIRSSPEMKEWRQSVFQRDDHICQGCRTRGGDLHAHHIMFFNSFPEGRFLVSNGQTLCVKCHRKLHKEMG